MRRGGNAGTVGAAGDNVGVSKVAVSDLVWGALASPVGEISVACSAAGVAKVRFGPPPDHGHASGRPGGPGRQLGAALGQLTEYFAGQRRAFDLPVDWPGMSPAQRQVLPVLLASAGYGETVTYGELARRLGTPQAVRAVAGACGANAVAVAIPCHRVVRGTGDLGGYRWGTERKKALLEMEQGAGKES